MKNIIINLRKCHFRALLRGKCFMITVRSAALGDAERILEIYDYSIKIRYEF